MDPLAETPKCKNCDAPMWPGDTFCADCGQKKYDGPPSFWRLFGDFFEAVFNLDNKLFRTLGTLIVPGRLTNYYLAGKQKPYLNPLRVFFVSSVVMLASFTFLLSGFFRADLDDQQKETHERGHRIIFFEELGNGLDTIRSIYPDFGPQDAIDSLEQLLVTNQFDSTGAVYFEYSGGLNFEAEMIPVSMRDLVELSPEEIVDKYEVTGWFERYQVMQTLRIQDTNAQGVFVMFSQLIWGLLLLIPLCALIMKLFYIRRKKRFIEHFIFSLHTHTVFFLLFALSALIHYFTDFALAYAFAGGLITIYFFWALKAVYRQAWWKTMLKGFCLFMVYCVVINVCLTFSVIVSVMSY